MPVAAHARDGVLPRAHQVGLAAGLVLVLASLGHHPTTVDDRAGLRVGAPGPRGAGQANGVAAGGAPSPSQRNRRPLNVTTGSSGRSLPVEVLRVQGCLGPDDSGWGVVALLGNGTASRTPSERFQHTTVLLEPGIMPMLNWRNRRPRSPLGFSPSVHRAHCVASLSSGTQRFTTTKVAWLPTGTGPMLERNQHSCFISDDRFGSTGGSFDGAFAATLNYLARAESDPRWQVAECVSTVPSLGTHHPAAADGKVQPLPPSPQPSVFYVFPDSPELIGGVFHQTLNRIQEAGVVAGLLGTANGRAALGITAHGNGQPPRFVGWAGWFAAGRGEPLPEVVLRVERALVAVLWSKYEANISYVGPALNIADHKPAPGGVVLFPNAETTCPSCFLFLEVSLAHAMRTELIGADLAPAPGTFSFLFLNREPKYARSVANATDRVASWAAALAAAGLTGTTHLEDDLGRHGVDQIDFAHNHSIIVTPHGQQCSSFMFAPPCAIVVELFNYGNFNTMYAAQAVSSGHIYGFHYDLDGEQRCGPSHNYNSQGSAFRKCVRRGPTTYDQSLLEHHLVTTLLPLQAQCITQGFESLPVPNLTAVEMTFERGNASRIIDLYDPSVFLGQDWLMPSEKPFVEPVAQFRRCGDHPWLGPVKSPEDCAARILAQPAEGCSKTYFVFAEFGDGNCACAPPSSACSTEDSDTRAAKVASLYRIVDAPPT